jgi:hypothetical protein
MKIRINDLEKKDSVFENYGSLQTKRSPNDIGTTSRNLNNNSILSSRGFGTPNQKRNDKLFEFNNSSFL